LPAETERMKGKILVVDDDESLREIVSTRLSFVADEVQWARDGAEAWLMIERDPPDVLVTDLMMPRMSGEELCQRVRNSGHGESLWILMLTARKGAKKRVEGLLLGADDYLEKPFDLDELAARVCTGLRIRQLQRELQDMARYETIGWVAHAFGHEIRNPLAVIMANASVQREHQEVVTALIRAAETAVEKLRALGALEEAQSLASAADGLGGFSGLRAEMLELAETNLQLARRATAAVAALQRFSEGSSGELVPTDPRILVEDAIRLAFAGSTSRPELKTSAEQLPTVRCVPRDVILALTTALGRAAPSELRARGVLPRVEVTAMARGVVVRIEGPGDGTAPADLLVPRIAPYAPGERRSGLDVGLAHGVVALRAAGAGLSVGPGDEGGVVIEMLLPLAPR
jgi:two-component system sensor histidine kinase ChiS